MAERLTQGEYGTVLDALKKAAKGRDAEQKMVGLLADLRIARVQRKDGRDTLWLHHPQYEGDLMVPLNGPSQEAAA